MERCPVHHDTLDATGFCVAGQHDMDELERGSLQDLFRQIARDTMNATVNSIVQSIKKNVKPEAPTTWGEVADVLEHIRQGMEAVTYKNEEKTDADE